MSIATRVALWVIGVASVLGLGELVLGAARPAYDVWRARDWVEVPITAGHAEILPFHGVWHAWFTYTYVVDGVAHEGHRYAFAPPSTYASEDALIGFQDTLGDTAWVDPHDPSSAVVVRDLPPSAYRFTGLWHVAIGLAVLAVTRMIERLRHPVLLFVRFALTVPFAMLGLLLLLDSFNPFATMDLPNDGPGSLIDHALGDLSLALIALAAIIGLIGSRPVEPLAPVRPSRQSRPT